MAGNQSTILKQWTRIIQAWPKDKVRPENVSFQTIMQARVNKLTSPATAASNIKGNDALVSPAEPPSVNQEREARQIKALDALLANRFATKYPIPASVRHPRSMPTHYEDLIQELDEAPSRSRFGAFLKRIKGSLRLS